MTVVALALARGSVALACAPVDREAWVGRLQQAEDAYQALDGQRFADALEAAALDLPCVRTVLQPQDVATWHMLLAIRRYTTSSRHDVEESLAAAKDTWPDFELPASLVPEGHEIRSFQIPYETKREAAPAPIAGTLYFDGRPTPDRPVNRPTVFQHADADGNAAITAYLLPSEPLPSYEREPVGPVVGPTDPKQRRTAKWVALGVGGAALVNGAVFYGAAAAGQSRFEGPVPDDWDRDDLLALRNRTNTWSATSLTSFGLAAAAGISFVVLR